MANRYSAHNRYRQGLVSTPTANSGEIHLQIDPVDDELNYHLMGLRERVPQFRNVAQEMETEAKTQNDIISHLNMTVIKAQTGVKNKIRNLKERNVQKGSSHVAHVVLSAIACFLVVYLWAKFFRT